jgi:hypothetical protein
VIEGFEPSKNPPRSTEPAGRREQRPQQRHSRGGSQPQDRGRSAEGNGFGARGDRSRSGGQQPARRDGNRPRPAGSLVGGNR